MLANFFKKKKKVFVGLSGGVDSAVSLYLLKQAGYDVTGVFIKTWQPDYIECTWKQDRLDAIRICAQLNVPFLTLDLESDYKKQVIDYFLDEYKNNRVPNPDIFCNKYIKFGGFYDFAIKNGADYIATGHYAEIKDGNLYEARDKNKDQSYFLYQIDKKILPKILFPIGKLNKSKVRSLAKSRKLFVADKKDSQGICMLGDISVKDFLIRELNLKPGDVIDEQGEAIGTHFGSALYTIGERHGFRIDKKTDKDKPFYVVSKQAEFNRVLVSNTPPKVEKHTDIKLIQINWLTDVREGSKVQVRFRYHGQLFPVKLYEKESRCELTSEGEGVVSGQSAVFYRGDGEVTGGGIIA